MSLSGNPASRKRCAIASAAEVTLPTESVVLISINCLKMSRASRRVASSAGEGCCACIETANTRQKNMPSHCWLDRKSILRKDFRHTLRLKANRFVPQTPSWLAEGTVRCSACRSRRFGCELPGSSKIFEIRRSEVGERLEARRQDQFGDIFDSPLLLFTLYFPLYTPTGSRSWRAAFHSGARMLDFRTSDSALTQSSSSCPSDCPRSS